MSPRITAPADPDRSGGSHRPARLASDPEGSPVGSAFLRVFTREGREG
ncbi:hypothetical protein [Streptomyces sp. NPDC057496]